MHALHLFIKIKSAFLVVFNNQRVLQHALAIILIAVFGFDFTVHDLLADPQAAQSIEIAANKGVAIVQAGFGQFI